MKSLQRLLEYDDWANRETLGSLKAAGAVPPRPLRFLAHIVAAEQLWLGRLKQDKRVVVVWPELTLDQCEARIAELGRLWRSYLAEITPQKLGEKVAYVNSKGEPWTSTVGDILMHVILHSAYHRGQIAADVRAAGHTPAYTDFIHCVRQGFIE